MKINKIIASGQECVEGVTDNTIMPLTFCGVMSLFLTLNFPGIHNVRLLETLSFLVYVILNYSRLTFPDVLLTTLIFHGVFLLNYA